MSAFEIFIIVGRARAQQGQTLPKNPTFNKALYSLPLSSRKRYTHPESVTQFGFGTLLSSRA